MGEDEEDQVAATPGLEAGDQVRHHSFSVSHHGNSPTELSVVSFTNYKLSTLTGAVNSQLGKLYNISHSLSHSVTFL